MTDHIKRMLEPSWVERWRWHYDTKPASRESELAIVRWIEEFYNKHKEKPPKHFDREVVYDLLEKIHSELTRPSGDS